MPRNPSEKLSECFARAAGFRERAKAEIDSGSRAELLDLEAQWLQIADSYKLVKQSALSLNAVRARRFAEREMIAKTRGEILQVGRRVDACVPVNGAALAELLGVLVGVAIEHSDGKARAAFYVADGAAAELHHIIGMPDAYAQCVNGFSISTQSLACGLAVATKQPVITPDVSREPRWKPWLWLAQAFHYRACWSFPIAISSGAVLGSFAMYYEDACDATQGDLDLASVVTRIRWQYHFPTLTIQAPILLAAQILYVGCSPSGHIISRRRHNLFAFGAMQTALTEPDL